jgi:hypothetical protein
VRTLGGTREKGQQVSVMQQSSGIDVDTGRACSVRGPRDAEWQKVDHRLREYAKHRGSLDAAEAFDLLRAEQLRIYLFVGAATMYEYMERLLGYGPHAARERLRVARALATLPQTTAALARGERTYSAVRELTRVATAETEAEWLAATAGMVTGQIESVVAHHQQGDRPDDPTVPDLRPRMVRLELPTEVYALWRQARMVIAEERGSEITDAELVEAMCRRVIDPGTGASGPAHQIAYQQCPDCRRATQNGAGREIDVSAEAFERASCDARVLGSLDATTPEHATTTVTPRVREQVFARDQHRCKAPGCRAARNLEVHHIIEQARGGTHELSNLCLLCTGHHTAIHTGLLLMQGEAPYDLQFRWVFGAPLPIGLDPKTRAAMIQQRVHEILERPSGLNEGAPASDRATSVPAGTSGGSMPM